MRKLIASVMLVALVLTVAITSFAAPYYTITPTSTSAVCVVNQATSVVLWANVSSTLSRDGYLFVYGTDFGAYTYKSTQAYSTLIPRKLIPADIRYTQYTYDAFRQKFTKVPVVAPAKK